MGALMTSKRQKNAGWLLPEQLTGHDLLCLTIPVPDVREYRAALFGALKSLTEWWNWEKSYEQGDTRASQAAAYWRELLLDIEVQLCGGGELSPFDVRQNPETPCSLEKSTDEGETWEQWANLQLCPPNIKIGDNGQVLIFDPDTGEYLPPETDPDYDPRYDYPPPTTQPNDQCSAAMNAAIALRELHKNVTPLLSGDLTAIGIAGSLVGFVGIYFAVAVTVALIVPIAAAILSMALSTAIGQFNSTVEYKLRCIIAGHLNADGTLQAGGFNAILTEVFNTSGAIYQLVWYYLQVIGEAGLQNALRIAGGTTDDCGCSTCGEFYEGWDYNQIYPSGCTSFHMVADGYGFAYGRNSTGEPMTPFIGVGRSGAVSVNAGGVNNSRCWQQSNYYYSPDNANAIRCAELGVRFETECTITQTSFWYKLAAAQTYKGIFLRFYGADKTLRYASATANAVIDATWRKFTENTTVHGVKYVTFHCWVYGNTSALLDELRINAIGGLST